MMHKIRTHHKHPDGKIFSRMALLLGLSMSLVYPVFPNFVKEIVKTDSAVSIFYAIMAIMLFVGAIGSTILFRKVERTAIAKWGFGIAGVVFFLLVFATTIQELAILNTLKVWLKLFLIMALTLFVRDFTKAKDLGKEEGAFYKYSNIGYAIGPLLGGFIATQFGYEVVFFLASTISIVGLMYFYNKHVIQKHHAIINLKKQKKDSWIKNVKKFFSNKNRTKAFFVTIFLEGWFGFKTLYIPLYVVMSGYLASMTGIVIALGIIPLILIEERVGKYADKKGVHVPIPVGFFIMAISLIAVFFCPWPLVNFGILILVNIGAGFVEPLQEYLLMKNMSQEEEDDLYGIYMTADPLAYFMVPAFGAIILSFLRFEYLFLIFGIALLFFSIIMRNVLKK